jgi:hypothetical protein
MIFTPHLDEVFHVNDVSIMVVMVNSTAYLMIDVLLVIHHKIGN